MVSTSDSRIASQNHASSRLRCLSNCILCFGPNRENTGCKLERLEFDRSAMRFGFRKCFVAHRWPWEIVNAKDAERGRRQSMGSRVCNAAVNDMLCSFSRFASNN